MTQAVVRYVQASKQGNGPLIAKQEDVEWMVVSREAAFPVEYGVKGAELRAKLKWAIEKFIRAMELQGLTLIPLPDGNPLVVTDKEGKPMGYYSISKDLEKPAPDELLDHMTEGRGPETLKQPTNLDMSGGLVDYRIVGVFWAPQVSMEIAVERQKLLDAEKQSRNPRTWGYGKATPDRPSGVN